MTIGFVRRIWGSAIVFLAAVTLSCSSTKKIDGETHFLCAADDECTQKLGTGYGCVQKSCVKLAEKTASVVCYPGEKLSCSGASGCVGTKMCADGGLSFGECDCGEAGTRIDNGGQLPVIHRPDGGPNGCVTAEFQGEQVSQAIYVVLDQSAKMTETGDAGATWWQASTGGIEDFLNGPVQAVGSFGVQYFPLGLPPASCQAAAYDTPDAQTTISLGLQPIFASFAAHSPQRVLATATGPALQGALSYLKGQSTMLRAAVLMTAGAPEECQSSEITDLAALAATALQSDHVNTYVIGFGYAASVFNSVAAAGGTTAFPITGGDDRRAVTRAFESIIGYQAVCTFDLHQLVPPGMFIDPSLVSLSFDFPDGGVTEVTRVQNPEDCANYDRDGWYFNASTAQNGSTAQIVVCPSLCELPRATLRYEYSCRPRAHVADGGAQ